MADEWTPYGLEHLRSERLRKRRFGALAVVALLAIGYLLVAGGGSPNKETEIFANGKKQGTIGLDLATQDPKAKSRPDATIEVSPGRTSRPVEAGTTPESRPATVTAPPPYQVDPIDWMGLLLGLGPFILLATVLWLGFRRRAVPEDEVNFGVYKGAMPLEMITASHAHLVLSPKRAKASLFGKSRQDFIEDE